MSRYLFLAAFLVFVLFAFSAGVAAAQDRPIFRMDVERVVLPVAIMDKNGNIVKRRFFKENFRVFEECVEGVKERTVTDLNLFEGQPAAIIAAIDSSGSMTANVPSSHYASADNKLNYAKVWTETLLKSIFRNGTDLGSVAEFFTEPVLTIHDGKVQDTGKLRFFAVNQRWTDELGPIRQGVQDIDKAVGQTPLLEAVLGLSAYFEDERVPKDFLRILLLVSDGDDSEEIPNRPAFEDVISRTQQSQVLVFSIGMYSKESSIFKIRQAKDVLELMADATGGRAFFADSPGLLPDIFLNIEMAIRNMHYLHYRPEADSSGHRNIKVKLGEWTGRGENRKWKDFEYRVLHRTGYYY